MILWTQANFRAGDVQALSSALCVTCTEMIFSKEHQYNFALLRYMDTERQ